MPHAIIVKNFGGPEELKWAEIDRPSPDKNEVLIKTSVVGLNFIDIYHRQGLYPLPLPFTPGVESAGVITEVGQNVSTFKPGDRVACVSEPIGAYTTERVFPSTKLIKLPRSISDQTAAAIMLKGLTAAMLLRRVHKIIAGETVLIHAAAGGVGLILTQWATALGAIVIGTVGSKKKANLIKRFGARHAIIYQNQNFVESVSKITKEQGVSVVYDTVGLATFPKSLGCLKPRGLWVTFGNTSGPVPPILPLDLMKNGSLFMTRPILNHYIQTDIERQELALELFSAIRKQHIQVQINDMFELNEASKAHTLLQSRKTVGSTVLLP